MQSQRGLLLAVLDEVNAAVQTQRTRTFAYWHRHIVWISAIGLSVASWRKKKRCCGSDKSAHDLGRDKLKMLPYCESTEALYGEKRQVVYSGFCTNMILSEISPAETATRT